MVLYLLNTTIASGLALTFYHFLLKHEKTFVFNRFYLLLSLLTCLLAPLLSIETQTPISITDVSNILSIESSIEVVDNYETTIVEEMNNSSFGFWHILINFYVLGVLVLLIRFFRNLIILIKLSKTKSLINNKLKIIVLPGDSNSFSFFNYIFVNKDLIQNTEETNLILKHETAHCLQKHSIDIVFIELVKCFFWFNPFVWLYKEVMVENHEFLADAAVVNDGIEINNYSQSIINTKKTLSAYSLSSGFNMIQTKNRLKMLHQSKSTIMRKLIKTISVLVLFSMVFMLSVSATYKDPIVVLVDAGHGGKDSGHMNEKVINLNVAKLLEAKSNTNVTIKLLRKSDEFLSLKERVDYINELKPDLFLSIHCNAHSDVSKSGVEAFYYKGGQHQDASYAFSKHLISEQLALTTENGRIKTANFYLLKHADCPAAFIELGFLTNTKDKVRLMSEQGQLQVADAIYKALNSLRK